MWYSVGTISIAANGTTATGTGTAFLSNVRVGDGLVVSGSTTLYEVTNIASDTQITFTPTFSAAAVSNVSYAVVPVQGYQKDLADQVKLLLQQYGTIATSPTLQAFSNITGGADLLAYFTSPTVMATTAFTPFSRTILDDVDASSVQNTIGVYSKTAVDGLISTVNTAVAAKANKGANSDITSLTGLTTALSVAQGGTGVTTTAALLTALNTAGAYSKTNIVGTVSQTSSVPTGAIIETGTNANGTYTKFADGTMIGRYRASFSAVMTTSFGSMYVTPTLSGYTYPAPFVSIPACAIYVEQANTIAYLSSGGAGTATATPSFQMSCPVSTTQNMILQYVAVGRWY